MESSRQYCMFIHLSLLSGLILPGMGLVVPIILWLLKRENPEVDLHGRIVANWIISVLIYTIIATVLLVVGIGVLIFIAIGICTLVFAIVGGIRAADGEAWPYPLSLKILKSTAV